MCCGGVISAWGHTKKNSVYWKINIENHVCRHSDWLSGMWQPIRRFLPREWVVKSVIISVQSILIISRPIFFLFSTRQLKKKSSKTLADFKLEPHRGEKERLKLPSIISFDSDFSCVSLSFRFEWLSSTFQLDSRHWASKFVLTSPSPAPARRDMRAFFISPLDFSSPVSHSFTRCLPTSIRSDETDSTPKLENFTQIDHTSSMWLAWKGLTGIFEVHFHLSKDDRETKCMQYERCWWSWEQRQYLHYNRNFCCHTAPVVARGCLHSHGWICCSFLCVQCNRAISHCAPHRASILFSVVSS